MPRRYRMRRNKRTGGVIIPRKYFSNSGIKSIYSTRYKRARARTIVLKDTGELKGMDTDLQQNGAIVASTNTAGNSTILNLIEAGPGSWNRIGRKVSLKSVRLKGTAAYTYAAAAGTGIVSASVLRMVVVWDKQSSSLSQPTYATIFGQTSPSGTETSEVFDSLRYDNTGRFQVLRDTRFTGNPMLQNTDGGSSDAVTLYFPFDEYIDLKGRRTVFSNDDTPMSIDDISSGALYVYWRANVSDGTTSSWSVSGNSFARLRFTS